MYASRKNLAAVVSRSSSDAGQVRGMKGRTQRVLCIAKCNGRLRTRLDVFEILNHFLATIISNNRLHPKE
jgi:hypothetical protein